MADGSPVMLALTAWLESCKDDKGVISRSTVAMGIVVLDHIRTNCPTDKSSVLSKRGEVKGSRSGLPKILQKYGLPEDKIYLKEVTTRQGHQDGQRLFESLGWGGSLASLSPKKRDEYLLQGIQSLVVLAKQWLSRQALKVNFDRQLSPSAWISSILKEAKNRSGGKVEQHLVGAKLATRHPDVDVPNHPGHAGDVQTGRSGDFNIGTTCYHVTASPGSEVVRKCRDNLREGLHPLLLVPREQVDRARIIADDQGIGERLTIFALEEFIALNIIEMSTGDQRLFIENLRAIVEKYNTRLEAVETDLSLKIDLQ